MRTVAIAQARMGSTRVPGKVMRHLDSYERPVLRWTLDAIHAATGIDLIILATSRLPEDDVIADYANKHHFNCYRGSDLDVLDRFYQCAKKYNAEVVLRFTCDCPFLDPRVISEVIKLREATGASYASNCYPATYPDGLDTECFTFPALEAAWREATRSSDRDCLTQYIVRNRSRFPAVNLTCPIPELDKERWVLDTEDDWKFCQEAAKRIWNPGAGYLEILKALEAEPHLREINNAELGAGRNERFFEQIYTEPLRERRYDRSIAQLERATKRIPLGAQTFSKSHLQFPRGQAPLYVSHADGGRIFDIDGNDFVDLIGALCPVILGYRDVDVDRAIRHQLDSGISFSLPTELEDQLAERLCRLIPCAEMARFGKNGTDVTSAAIRVARAHTGKELVIVGGYHGWQDWSMGVIDKRSAGIPLSTRTLSLTLPSQLQDFNYPDKLAAIIIEPDALSIDHLRELRAFCDRWGIVLIFDEVITGFRYELGGAQQYFNVIPDLATFGKAMANGMPIAALVGREHIMRQLDSDKVFYSGTMFGETLSIAAAIACIDKLERENVIPKLWAQGAWLRDRINFLTNKYGIRDRIDLKGHACRTHLSCADGKVRTYFMTEMIRNGVLIINANTLSYAHRDVEMKRVISAYDTTLAGIAKGLHTEVKETIYAAPVRM